MIKSNEDYLFNNYRPVSILPSISKVSSKFDDISNWLKLNKLSQNVKKKKGMLFYTPQGNITPGLLINDTVIEFVDELSFLGITIALQAFELEKSH